VSDRLITVIGRGHGGTRAMAHTLSASGVFTGSPLNKSGDLVPAEEMYEACRVFARFVDWEGGLSWDFSRALQADPTPEFVDLIERYLTTVLSSPASRRGWKLPETTLAYPWIVKMFPTAHYIEWVRDPRDSILNQHVTDDLSLFGVSYDRTDDQRRNRAISWLYQRELMAATPKPANVIQVRFEDFVLDQGRTLAAIEDFLGFELARIPVTPDAVGRWRHDDGRHTFDFFEKDLVDLGYAEAAG